MAPTMSDSDLPAIPFTLGALLAIVIVIGTFFLVGVVGGLIVLFAVLVLGGYLLIRLIGANENE